MKLLKLPLLGLSALLFFGCQKATLQDSTATNLLKAEPLTVSTSTTNCLGYTFQLDVDKTSQPGYTIFVWTITNPNPGNARNNSGTIQNLSHWDFAPSQCLTDNWQDVKEASYNLNDGTGWQQILPLPTVQPDNAMDAGTTFNCTTGDVFKFNYGTNGGTPTQYKIVLEGNWGTADLLTYFKSGKSGCCSDTYANMGIGCKVEEDKCSFSQGYWFATNAQHPDGVHPWPGNVTIGGETYTNKEGIAISNANTQGGLKDAQAAFTQLAAFRISGASAADPAVKAAIETIDNWLKNYGAKLTPDNLRNQTAVEKQAYGDAKAASDIISQWITNHHC
jgi:hypothetical protein